MIIQNGNIEYFFGVVEDRNDPLQYGRVRVRVFGVHPFGKSQGDVSGLPTEELLWMPIIIPSTSASSSGVGSSPTGLVEGSHVFGFWLDKYKTNGIVIGTWYGGVAEKPNYSEGFSDPSGQYPRYVGSDVNPLAQGGDIGKNYETNIIQDQNTETAPNPNQDNLDDQEEDNNPNYTIEQMLQNDEGLRLTWYTDSEGYPTIGIGHLIASEKTTDTKKINKWLSSLVGRPVNNGRITMDECSAIFKNDISKTINGIKNNSTIAPVYSKCNRSRQMALENMAFQMGVGGLAKFKTTLKFMEDEEWEKAYINMRKSLWFQQTKGRASRVSLIVRTGNLNSYGVPVGKKLKRTARMAKRELSPEDPSKPNTSPVMFEEPKTSYETTYPYNNAFTSESGHVQEFDDTPGKERYRLTHPSGTYTEVSPDGQQVNKIVGDRYQITRGTDHVLIQGDVNLVIGTNSNVYIMGNSNLTVDGNVNQLIHGNVIQHIEGNVKADIDQTANITVKEEAFVTVEKDLIAQVNMNATVNVEETTEVNSKTINMNADDINLNGKNININASKNTMIDSGQLTKVTGGNVQVG